MKCCPKCLNYQSESAFTKASSTSDGLNCWCKTCTRNNSREGYYKNRDERKRQVASYRKTASGKQVSKRATTKWKALNPKKYIAHVAVNMAVERGIIKVEKCKCGASKVHAHHSDYDRVFDIQWLCPQCHKDAHRLPTISQH